MASLKGDPVITFYATVEELAEWLTDWVKRFRLYFIFIRGAREELCRKIDWDDAGAVRKAVTHFDQVILDVIPIGPEAKSDYDLASTNHHRLVIRFPNDYSSKGLSPGTVGTVASKAKQLKVWRAIRQEILDRTQAGLWDLNTKMSKRWRSDVRFTEALQKQVEANAVSLENDHSTYHLEDPPPEKRKPAKRRELPRRHLKVGDTVIWWKSQQAGKVVVPIVATVRELLTTQVKLELEDFDHPGEQITRNVSPLRLVADWNLPKATLPVTPLVARGEYWYGDTPHHICASLIEHTKKACEPIKDFAQAVCKCGHDVFSVVFGPGYARRICVKCDEGQILTDLKYEEEGETYLAECVCFGEEFQVVGSVAGYDDTPTDGKWFYIGLRCVECGCCGCYRDELVRWCSCYPWWEYM